MADGNDSNSYNLISMCHCASSHGGGEHEANMQNLSHGLLLDLLRSSMNITILFPNDQDTMIFKVKHIVFRVLKVISMEVDDDIRIPYPVFQNGGPGEFKEFINLFYIYIYLNS